MYVVMYLFAIVAANLLVARFGPAMSIVNAFIFVGFDLVARDKLHEAWHNNHLVLKMGLLIAAGGVLSWLLNRDAAQIALASSIAFALAALADTVVYAMARARHWSWLARSNGSNVVSSAVDSLVFPTIAFGSLLPAVIALQFIAKVGGGLLWSLLLRRRIAC